jgi:hypothetical protein
MPRVRPHFKAHTSISHHRKMSEVFPDNDLLALWLRLGVLAIERYAAKSGDVLRVHRSELSALCGGKRRDKAEVTLKLLASKLELTLNKHGEYFEIEWRNLSIKQGFAPKNGRRIENPNTNTNTNTVVESDECLLPAEFVEQLRQVRPGGVLFSKEQVENWFERKLPIMKARGIKNFKRAASNWWNRASKREVEEATNWVEMRRLEKVKRSTKNKQAEEADSLEDFASMFTGGNGDGVSN